ncbi:hypothetical protein JMJ77_0010041, partial [Colletotrichum scovillei]
MHVKSSWNSGKIGCRKPESLESPPLSLPIVPASRLNTTPLVSLSLVHGADSESGLISPQSSTLKHFTNLLLPKYFICAI